jgi:hypothetical protein
MSAIPPPPHYSSYTEGRTHFKDLLDAAERDQVGQIERDGELTVILSGDRLRRLLAENNPANAEVVCVDGLWSMYLSRYAGVMADGVSLDDVILATIEAVREYAKDWNDHLRAAPNHQHAWGMVQLSALCDDAQLRDWLLGDL